MLRLSGTRKKRWYLCAFWGIDLIEQAGVVTITGGSLPAFVFRRSVSVGLSVLVPWHRGVCFRQVVSLMRRPSTRDRLEQQVWTKRVSGKQMLHQLNAV